MLNFFGISSYVSHFCPQKCKRENWKRAKLGKKPYLMPVSSPGPCHFMEVVHFQAILRLIQTFDSFTLYTFVVKSGRPNYWHFSAFSWFHASMKHCCYVFCSPFTQSIFSKCKQKKSWHPDKISMRVHLAALHAQGQQMSTITWVTRALDSLALCQILAL